MCYVLQEQNIVQTHTSFPPLHTTQNEISFIKSIQFIHHFNFDDTTIKLIYTHLMLNPQMRNTFQKVHLVLISG